MTALPLPTVTPIDTTAERLADVDRRTDLAKAAVRPAAQVQGALEGADAGIKAFDAIDARGKAAFFQKILDAGEPARLEYWQEAGAAPQMDPRQWVNPAAKPDEQRQQAENWYKEMASVVEKAEHKKGQVELVATLGKADAKPGDVAAAAVKAGGTTGDVLDYAGRAATAKAKADEDALKKPGRDLDEEYKRLRNAGQRALNEARRNKNKGLMAVIGNDLKDLKRVRDKLALVPEDDPAKSGERTALMSEASKISARIASYSRDADPAKVAEMADSSGVSDDEEDVETQITVDSTDDEIAAEIRKARGYPADKKIPKAAIDAVRARLTEGG